MSGSARVMVIALVLLSGVALDQATKRVAIAKLSEESGSAPGFRRAKAIIPFPRSWYPNDLFRFQYAENEGAFLSMFSSLPGAARFWILIGLNSVILVVVGLFLALKRGLMPSVVVALSLILSGGVGNIIDRLFHDGRVVDFMNMGIGAGKWSLRTGIFNVADLAIVGGLLLLLFFEYFRSRPEKTRPPRKETGGT